MDGRVMETAPHTCEVLQRRALDPEAEHLLHRQINRIIPVRRHGRAAAARGSNPSLTQSWICLWPKAWRRPGWHEGVRRLSPARLASTGASASA